MVGCVWVVAAFTAVGSVLVVFGCIVAGCCLCLLSCVGLVFMYFVMDFCATVFWWLVVLHLLLVLISALVLSFCFVRCLCILVIVASVLFGGICVAWWFGGSWFAC